MPTVDNFVSGDGAVAKDASDHLLYDTATGNLYYDADGSGKAVATLIAVFDNNALLTVDQLIVM